MGGWPGGMKIKIKVHLRPAEAEVGAELGKSIKFLYSALKVPNFGYS